MLQSMKSVFCVGDMSVLVQFACPDDSSKIPLSVVKRAYDGTVNHYAHIVQDSLKSIEGARLPIQMGVESLVDDRSDQFISRFVHLIYYLYAKGEIEVSLIEISFKETYRVSTVYEFELSDYQSVTREVDANNHGEEKVKEAAREYMKIMKGIEESKDASEGTVEKVSVEDLEDRKISEDPL